MGGLICMGVGGCRVGGVICVGGRMVKGSWSAPVFLQLKK